MGGGSADIYSHSHLKWKTGGEKQNMERQIKSVFSSSK